MNDKLTQYFDRIKIIARIMSENNWAEANAGNISINITDIHGNNKLNKRQKIKFRNPYKNTYGQVLLITQSGKRMRDIALNPEEHITIIRLYKNYFEILNNTKNMPSSELISHIAIHDYFVKSKSNNKVIIHSHPTEIIALSHIEKYASSKKIIELLNNMHTEIKMLLPNGIGFIRELTPGSSELAKETLKIIKKYDICIWQKHGCISIGKDIDSAFDKIEIVNKSASIFLEINKCKEF